MTAAPDRPVTAAPDRPATAPDRWRPTRAGLVSIWRYWDEVFSFHHGRLLLRGPNGSGKSLALELLLPFLLDADASPSRLTSATKSRGGLYDRVMTGTDEPSRTGFAWVEFRRPRPGEATEEVFTVGARIRASQATRRADTDYFTTTLAVGDGLHLLDEHRVPISRQALVEAIGDTGAVHANGEAHRAAVRAALFPGFGADRYASVVGALLTLRKEKLSQQLVNADELSQVLSASLPPLDDHDITAVAEGFERLDRRKAEIDAVAKELEQVRLLAERQRAYARAVVVAGARAVVSAETRRDDVTRQERQAREELDAVRADAEAADADLRATEARVGEIGVEIEARKDSDAYREGVALAGLHEQARRLADNAERHRRAAEQARTASTRAADERSAAADASATAAANLEHAARDLRAAAQDAGADAVVTESESADDGERLVTAWADARRRLVTQVRAALADHDRAVERRRLYEEQVEESEKVLASRADAHTRARSDAAGAAERYGHEVGQWASGCAVVGPDRLAGALPHPPDDPDAVDRSLAGVRAAVEGELAVAGRDLDAAREAAEAERAELLSERARWEHSALPDLEPPSWRSPRDGLAGAPLWSAVDPRPGTPPEVVDRLEAALAAAGLLDAWVEPDGAVTLAAGRADLVLTARPGDPTGPAPAGTLGALLAPAPAGALPEATVAGVLAAVALVDTALPAGGTAGAAGPEVAVGRDGTYRLGRAVGRGPDRPASVLGAPARERYRQSRLAQIDAALAVGAERLEVLRRQREDLERRAAAARAELEAVPSGAPVREAARRAGDAAVRLEEARARAEGARLDLRRAEEEVRTALRALTSLSAQHGLPAERAGLDAVEAGLRALESAATTWARRQRDAARAAADLRRAEGLAAQMEEALSRAEADHAAAAADAEQAAARVAALDASVRVEYREVLERIEALAAERSTAQGRIEELRRRTPQLQERVGQLKQTVEDAAEARHQAEETREAARGHLVAVTDDLLGDAGLPAPGPLDGVSAALTFARTLLADHGQAPSEPEAVERLSGRVGDQVHQASTALGARVQVDREFVGQWWVLRTTAGGLRRRAGELVDALAGELERGRAELADEEERLFEQTLAGSVRRAIAERIRQANALVEEINHQLDAVRTAAAGVSVRLQWAVDPDQLDAVKAARSLLLRDPADLSDAERASLQEFVRARVDQARAEQGGNAPWEARLRETLDYRAWHRFTLQVAHRDWDGYQPATARRLQRLSTGERSMALHLPMIASVAAHYAGPSGCPRLILLDELFAGVDTANRAQLFGTFSAWDLDAVFTSDHEWCQYATLDGIAIHHLHPAGPDEPVTSTRFTWDGRQRRIDPGASAA